MFNNSRFKVLMALAAVLFFAHPSISNAVDVKADGFGSLYYGQAFNNGLQPYGFSNSTLLGGAGTNGTSPDFLDFSLIGGDISAKFSDDWSAAAEFVTQGQFGQGGEASYGVFTQWAYVNYVPMEGLSVKVGRQLYPVWIGSEYVNKHFDLPFRVMPQVVYQMSPFSSLDGASITETAKCGDSMKASVQVFGGQAVLNNLNTSYLSNNGVNSFSGNNLIGGRVGLEGEGWMARFQISRATEAINTTNVGQSIASPTTWTAGYRLDKNNFVSWGEYGHLSSSDGGTFGTSSAFHSAKAGYVMVGYRLLDKWLPRYTFAQGSYDEGFSEGKLTTHTIGLNYQANEHVIVKAEFELDSVPTAAGGPVTVITQPGNTTSTSGTAFYLGADIEI